MKKLNNGICTYKERWINGKTLFQVLARFRGNIEVVFESFDLNDCKRYAHENGMRIMPEHKRLCIVYASFRKINAKNPFREEDYAFGNVG